MADFANLADGGRRLAPLVAAAVAGRGNAVLLAAVPNGVPVALAVAEATGLPVLPLPVARGDDGVAIAPVPGVRDLVVVVVDDGVETGSVARAAAGALAGAGAAAVLLAVPVCPREATADLALRYDEVIAVVRPMARRDLAWHYEDFDTIDAPTAHDLLAAALRTDS